MPTSWTPWHDVVAVRDDVKNDKLTLDIFAADLHDVMMQENERPVYENPTEFFKLTYPTRNLRELAHDVAERLAGESDKAVRQLSLTYGGGKTHSMITLYHLFGSPDTLPDVPAVDEFKSHIDRPLLNAAIAALPFDYFDTTNGMKVYSPDGTLKQLYEPWSALAYQLAGDEGLRILNDDNVEERTDPPATNTLVELLRAPAANDASVLLLLDEILMYVQSRVSKDRGMEQPLINFFQCLTQAVSKVDRCCMIASILASDLNAYTQLGKQLEKQVADIFRRKDDESVRPVEKHDIAEILRRRFFTLDSIRDKSAFRPHVTAALKGITSLDEETKKQGKEAEDRFLESYPFHPDLTDIFYEKWTNLESFQEARGVLRIMALAIRDASKWDESPLISTNIFLSAPGQQELSAAADELASIARQAEYEGERQGWSTILEGELGRARGIQEQYSALEGREVEQFLMGIFLHSQPKGRKGELLALKRLVGHTRPDTIELNKALQELTRTSWFLDEDHFPQEQNEVARLWRLGSRPNLTQMHHDARSRVEDLVDDALTTAIDNARSLTRGASGAGAAVHKLPNSPADIKDDGRFHYAVLGPEAASRPGSPSDRAVRFLTETTTADRPRVNKNALVLAVPSSDVLDTARGHIRNHLAWKEVRDNMLDKDEVDETRRHRLQRYVSESKDKIADAVRQAYSVAVTLNRDGKPIAFKVSGGESSLFQQIKAHDKARIKDAAITPEAILPNGPYDLWREDEAKRRVAHITEAFAQQTRLPKMLNTDGIYDTIARGCSDGTFVLRLERPDGSARTAWYASPGRSFLEDDSLYAVLPDHAELASVDPALLKPDALPGLWDDDERLSVQTLYDYFSGDHAAEIPMDGYSEYKPIPKASAEVLHAAIREGVSRSMLWLQQGQTSLFGEDVPEGLISAETTLQPPPESISPTELLPANLSNAWEDGSTTASRLAEALSAKKGEPLPWPLVRQTISSAFQASYLTRSVKSGPWPTDRSGADQVVIEVPKETESPSNVSGDGSSPTSQEVPPAGTFGSTIARAESTLEAHQLQDLADEIAEIEKIAAPFGIQFRLQIDVGTDKELPSDVRARLNDVLRRVAEELEV
ncbi:MAG: ATP-binding protein [Spiribacter salinus]|uniref:ATP-binding protein n=1 Tax=Spiribacter salinus TaxID=1335746 RepID=A0A540VPB8_9GAMM|nr:MAG: ATP-binding protein [Spiribacter salinus]